MRPLSHLVFLMEPIIEINVCVCVRENARVCDCHLQRKRCHREEPPTCDVTRMRVPFITVIIFAIPYLFGMHAPHATHRRHLRHAVRASTMPEIAAEIIVITITAQFGTALRALHRRELHELLRATGFADNDERTRLLANNRRSGVSARTAKLSSVESKSGVKKHTTVLQNDEETAKSTQARARHTRFAVSEETVLARTSFIRFLTFHKSAVFRNRSRSIRS